MAQRLPLQLQARLELACAGVFARPVSPRKQKERSSEIAENRRIVNVLMARLACQPG